MDTQLVEPISARELRSGRAGWRWRSSARTACASSRVRSRSRWHSSRRGCRLDVGAWWDGLAEAGERIGATFAALPREAEKSSATAAGADTAKAEFELMRAARLARLMDGSTLLVTTNPAALRNASTGPTSCSSPRPDVRLKTAGPTSEWEATRRTASGPRKPI